ncbi:hypothetical protein [Chryseobacterium gossypii]|uniref:hypothetical protein n=1 Tax=Chryseobacterium gossypii TaxID=3231602 RepID=UPI003526327A
MNKQLFLVLLLTATLSLVTVNCSNSSDDDTPNNQQTPATTQYFHPPAWIQDSWAVSNGTITNKLFRFTDSDFISLASGSEISHTGLIKAHPYGGSVDETSNTSSLYIFDIKFNNSGVTQHYEFRKVSATQIQWYSNGTWIDLIKL